MMDLVIQLDRLTREQRGQVLDLVDLIYGSQAPDAPKTTAVDLSDISLDLAAPPAAAVFGGAAGQVPPAPAAPVVPQPPANTPASPTLPPGASTPPTAGSQMGLGGVPGVSVDLDAEGIPWDSRIHASSKVKTDKGVWRARRGMNDEALVNRVKAELRAALAVMPPVSFPSQPAAGTVPTPPATATPPAISGAQIPPPPVTQAGPPQTFATLMQWLTPLLATGKLTNAAVASALGANGVESLPTLATRADLVPPVHATLATMVTA